MMRKLVVAMALVLSLSTLSLANGEPCMFDANCPPPAKCYKNAVGVDGVCAGGY